MEDNRQTQFGGDIDANTDELESLLTAPDSVLKGDAVHGTGAVLTATTALTYTYTVTVVAGSIYRIKANDGLLYFGMGAGGTAANTSWFLSAGEQTVITIPSGAGTTLYYHSTSDGITGRIAKVKV